MNQARPQIAITHREEQLKNHFSPADLDRLHAVADTFLVGTRDDCDLSALKHADYLLGSWGMPTIDQKLLDAAPQLKAVCYAAGSIKYFVTPEAYQRDIVFTTAMHENAIPVAEWCHALIMMINKDFFGSLAVIREHGKAGFHNNDDSPVSLSAPGNYDVTVGLVSFGAVARELAKRLQPMDIEVIAYDPFASTDDMATYGVRKVDTLLEVAQTSRILSLHAPNIDACAGMINQEVLQAMPDGASFINTARGRIVNEDDLVAELKTGRIQAFLDVTFPEPPEEGHPFYSMPNCFLTPHRAGSFSNEIRRMGRHAIDECLRLINGEKALTAVSEAQLATMA